MRCGQAITIRNALSNILDDEHVFNRLEEIDFAALTDMVENRENNKSINLFDTLEYDVNKVFTGFITSMDFTVVKVGDEYSLRDDANLGNIHSDRFDSAMAMTDRLDVYIEDYYIYDTLSLIKSNGLEDILTDDSPSLLQICEDINAASGDERVQKFFNEYRSTMEIIDLIVNRIDDVDLSIAFKDAPVEESEIKWTPIPETADDNGNPTSYSTKYRGETFFISENGDGKYDVESENMRHHGQTYYAPINEDFSGFLSRADAEEYFADIPAPAESRKFSYQAVNGELYYREAGDTMEKVPVKGKGKDKIARAVAMVELRDTVRELLDLQMNNADSSLDSAISESRAKLNKVYDDFVAKYGFVSDKKNKDAFKGDDDYQLLSALENEDKEHGTFSKADIFEHNTVKPKTIAEHVETAQEALIISVSEKAKVDFDFMSELCGMDKDSMIADLKGQIFRLPQAEEKYVTSDEYLTGNIRKKIAELNNAPEGMDVSENRAALENAIPPRVEAKDISVKLGSHWIAPEYIRQFICEKFNPDWNAKRDMTVQYSKAAGEWKIEDVNAASKKNYTATNVFGTHRMHAYKILEGILNNSDLQVKDHKKDENGYDMRDEKGNYILVVNQEETKAVRQVANLIKSEFQDWIFKDPERREKLVQTYNEMYNSIRPREYDGSHLNFVGMNTDITLKEHQKNAIARALYGGNTLLAHAVGAGKTFEMIAIAMEGKRLGLHTKSLFAVPNSLTEQMGNDFRRLYPNANILVATKKDFEKANRLKLFAKIAANDWDAVIVGHTQFDRMGLSPEREQEYIKAELEKLREELEYAAEYGEKSFSVKKIENAIASYQDRLNKLNDAQVKDDFIDFEKLGFDKLFIDECHMYKNLATATKMHNVSGLGSGGAARSFNLLMKSKYMDEITGGKGQTYASGTPIITGYQRSKTPILRCYTPPPYIPTPGRYTAAVISVYIP